MREVSEVDRTTRAGVVLLLVIGAVMVAGCGGGSSSSSSGESGSSPSGESTSTSESSNSEGEPSSAIAAAEAEVAKYTKPQPPIEIAPLGEAPAKGKKIAVMTCQPAECVGAIAGAEQAAKELGWSVQSFNNPFTPEGYAAAWDEIIQARPDGVVYVGVLPNELIEKQLAELNELKIPIMGIASARLGVGQGEIPPGGPIYGAFAGQPDFALAGKLMGDIILADHQEAPEEVLITSDKTQEANDGIVIEEFEKSIEGAGGKVKALEVNFEQEGKGIPGQIVSYIQSNPQVEYVAFQAASYAIGVSAALKAAGLSEKVKLVTRAATPANVKEMENGEMFALVAEEDSTTGWRGVNALVQRFAGKEDYEAEPVGWHQIINSENVSGFKLDSLGSPAVPGDPEAFLKAWGLE